MNKNELQAELKRKNYTYHTFAEKLGISPSSFQNKIMGTNDFTLAEVKRIVEILKLTQRQMLNIFFK